MANEKNNLDDLFGTSGSSPIIVQESGSDKKILYILLIALLVLFLLAIGLIAYLGGKYFSQNNGQVATQSAVIATTQNSTTKQITSQNVTTKDVQEEPKASAQEVSELEQMVVKEEAKKAIAASRVQESVAAKSQVTQQEAQVAPKEQKVNSQVTQQVSKEEVEVNQVTQKPISQQGKVIQEAAQITTGKRLTQEDIAKIVALVAKELAKSKKEDGSQVKSVAHKGSAQDDAALVAQLEKAQTDTLVNEELTVPKKIKVDVKAGSKKKVDTFNKVIVASKGDSNDELTKLAQEIDSILKSEDVQRETQKVKYVKELSKEAEQRAKEMRFIVVKRGDTLSSIAYRAYGRASAYRKIYEANPDIIRNPNRIYVGMRLRVPVDEEYKEFQGKKNAQ